MAADGIYGRSAPPSPVRRRGSDRPGFVSIGWPAKAADPIVTVTRHLRDARPLGLSRPGGSRSPPPVPSGTASAPGRSTASPNSCGQHSWAGMVAKPRPCVEHKEARASLRRNSSCLMRARERAGRVSTRYTAPPWPSNTGREKSSARTEFNAQKKAHCMHVNQSMRTIMR
jgi:hypothetical protein